MPIGMLYFVTRTLNESVDTQIVIVKYRILYDLFGLSPLIAFFFFHLLIKPSFLDNFGFISVS